MESVDELLHKIGRGGHFTEQEKKAEKQRALDRLWKAHQNYITALCKVITFKALKTLRNGYEHFMIDYDNIGFDREGYSTQHILFGMWDEERQQYSRELHYEAGIVTIPIKETTDNLRPLGYILEDISDNRKSERNMLKVTLISSNRNIENNVIKKTFVKKTFDKKPFDNKTFVKKNNSNNMYEALN